MNRHKDVLPSSVYMSCQRCGEEFRVLVDGLNRQQIEKKKKTYLCPQHRRDVSDDDIREMERAGLR